MLTLTLFVLAISLRITNQKNFEDNGKPFFDPESPRNLTVQSGGTAYLPCKVINLGNNSVSWIRNKDSHIISVDQGTFIVDDRFTPLYNPVTQTWTLQIKSVQARDAGTYECQISTVPKMTHFFNLAIVVPKVRIVGSKDIHVKAGSLVRIECVVSQAVQHPTFIVWYRDGSGIVSDGKRVTTGFVERVTPDTSTASLTIAEVVKEDAGTYSCQPTNLPEAEVKLHVVNGEMSEPSIQSSTTSTSYPYSNWLILGIVLLNTGKLFS